MSQLGNLRMLTAKATTELLTSARRIEKLRQEVADAEHRAGLVSDELKELGDTLSVREKALEVKAAELDRCIACKPI